MDYLRKRRATTLLWIFVLVFMGLVGRLAYIQVHSGLYLSRQAMSQQSQTVGLEIPPRGRILDRNLKPLTYHRLVWRVVVFPAAVADAGKEAETAAAVLGLPVSELNDYFSGQPRMLPYDLSDKKAAELKKRELTGVIVARVRIQDRKPSLASHLVGYLGIGQDSKWQGMMGIEAFYNQVLASTEPETALRAFMDARGRFISGLGLRLESGADMKRREVVLTIDRDIQEIVEKVIDRAGVRDGAVVVMDVHTGDIVAMASRPDYDLGPREDTMAVNKSVSNAIYGLAEGSVSSAVYQSAYNTALPEERSFLNRCMSIYQPGSVFKVIVAAAALEEGIVKPDTTFLCTGDRDELVKCYKKNGHGLITFAQAVAYSCNPTFARVGLKLGADRLVKYAMKFGLDNGSIIGYRKTNLSNQLKQIALPHNLVNSSLGQWPVRASVVQITSMMGTIANDGMYTPPRLVREIRDVHGNLTEKINPGREIRAVSKKTADIIKIMLEMVTRYGTGKQAYVETWGSAGKTGSAQVGNEKTDAWFSGYAPVGEPRYVATVLVNNGESGGKTAAPLFRGIMQEILQKEAGSKNVK